MKEIPNATYAVENGEPTTVAKLLASCLESMPPGGLDFATIRARLRVTKAIEGLKDGDMIKLEDADFTAAKLAIEHTRWVRPQAHLIAFAELFHL